MNISQLDNELIQDLMDIGKRFRFSDNVLDHYKILSSCIDEFLRLFNTYPDSKTVFRTKFEFFMYGVSFAKKHIPK